ncbi:antibiotic biosynthesis monooxygenase [Rhizoctonia solani 123E]|uniref:Antibiotic biosynthesis monooxygenase n=1 Tax=Rhizoctonia solani 123E TaxID=1423351 RepID=A0A074SXT8_9AGAM|nr:antibiotic biosynthesis monooxygenase [Rhizoctonia solani 123E]
MIRSTRDGHNHRRPDTQEGQAEKTESLLKAIQTYSTSDKEPGCLTYRVCRSGNEFFIFEQYADSDAIQTHFGLEGFKNLVNEVGKGTLVVGVSKSFLHATIIHVLHRDQEYPIMKKFKFFALYG